jgi:iron complex transport system ATP-binding protein
MKLEIKSLSFKYKTKEIFKNINIDFKSNEISLIFGDNGVGKSTFFKFLLGDITNYEGNIFINNKNIKELSIIDRSLIFSLCSASQPNILIKVKEVFDFSSIDMEYSEKVIQDFKLEDYLNREMSSLSEGEKQWIFLARAFSRNTECMLLDEPTTFLDRTHKNEFIRLVKKYGNEKTILINTHDEKLLEITQNNLFEIRNFQILPTNQIL